MEGSRCSPTSVATSLEYITVENYAWPKPEPVKRCRLDDDERRRRHREGQRQFMTRKRRRLHVLQREIAMLQLQRKWLQGIREQKTLELERQQLAQQLHSRGVSAQHNHGPYAFVQRKRSTFTGPSDSEVLDSNEIESMLVEAILSW